MTAQVDEATSPPSSRPGEIAQELSVHQVNQVVEDQRYSMSDQPGSKLARAPPGMAGTVAD
jgi:hypothetical protein